MMEDYDRSRLQKVILLLLLVMAVVFGVLTGYFQSKPGAPYERTLLYPSQEGDTTTYTGKLHGQTVSVARRPDGTSVDVDLTVDGELVHACRVEYPEGTVTDGDGDAFPRVEILRDGEALFRGGYNPNSHSLFEEDGSWHSGVVIYAGTELPEPDFDEFDILRFARGPARSRRGSWAAWAMAALLLSGITALGVAFPMTMFRLNHFLSVKDPEPTEFYLSMQRLSWVVLTAFIFGFYLWSLTIID